VLLLPLRGVDEADALGPGPGPDQKCQGVEKSELGDSWSLGVRNRLVPGQIINVELNTKGNSEGSLQLYLCSRNAKHLSECGAEHEIEINNKTLIKGDKSILQYQLPEKLDCPRCVLYWKYTTKTLVKDEYIACADVGIVNEGIDDESQENSTNIVIDAGILPRDQVGRSDEKELVSEGLETMTVRNIVAGIESSVATEQSVTTLSSSVVSSLTAGVSTIAPIVIIENRTVSIEPPLTTIESAEIVSDENNTNIDDDADQTEVISGEKVDAAVGFEEITVKTGVIEIMLVGNTNSKKDMNLYTIAPEVVPLEYSLIRTHNDTFEDETDEEDDKQEYEITRTKPTTTKSDTPSSPEIVSSINPLSTPIPSPQTTDGISVKDSAITTVFVAETTTSQKGTTPSTITQTIMMSRTSKHSTSTTRVTTMSPKTSTTATTARFTTTAASKVPKVATQESSIVFGESASLTTTTQLSTIPTILPTTTSTIQPTTTSTILSTTTNTKLPTTTSSILSTTTSSILSTTTSSILSITTSTILSTTTSTTTTTNYKTEVTVSPLNNSNQKKFAPSILNSIILEPLDKNSKVQSTEENGADAIQPNHTVIYQVFSRNDSLDYGLILSVPAVIIFFIAVFLFYLKKNSLVSPVPRKPQNYSHADHDRMYHSIPRDDMEEGEEDVSQLTNMTSSTALISSEYIPNLPTMSPEYAYIPDVVPSSVRNSQRPRLNDSVEESNPNMNSLPNLNQVTSAPTEDVEVYQATTAVQYSSLNELNSTENAAQLEVVEIGSKRCESAGLESWPQRQRWKSEDWEKDQSFIAMLARRLEHVDSRAEVTEL